MATFETDSSLSTLAPLVGGSLGKQAIMVLGGTVLLAVLSQVAIGYPVPTTLQTLGVMLIGLTFGFRLAAATVLTYLLCGAVGLPFFAPFGAGTTGYLVGFLFGAALIGFLADQGATKTWAGTIVTLLAGEAVIFAMGIAGLMLAFQMTLSEALAAGLMPFILVDGIKIVLAAMFGKGVLKGAEAYLKP